jgi:hypothetical protein
MSINPYLENNPNTGGACLIKNVVFIPPAPSHVRLIMTQGNRVCKYIWISKDCMTSNIQSVSGGIVNILGDGSMEYSE